MIKRNQDGAVNILMMGLIVVTLGLIGALSFGAWAFSGRQDYKNNTDAKIQLAVQVAKQQESTSKDVQFAEIQKQPLRTYNGPQAYGSLVVNFPKSWSGYVDDSGTAQALVDGYFSPGTVPSITAQSSVFALRVQVIGQPYSQVIQTYTSQQQSGQLTATTYALPKVPSAVGVEVSGTFPDQTTGTMVILPLRNTTLQISTQGNQFINDFNNYILPNFSFSP